MADTILSEDPKDMELSENGYFKKGCNPLAQTGRSKLQNSRALLNQQIIKEMRMRAGAENLLQATSNNKVREMVLLELSYVNSNLQLLMEELEGLNSSVEVYQNENEMLSIPLIPLGLKETKEVDFTVAFKDFILEHYSEDSSNYETEIADLMDLRQACRTPSRTEAGVDLLMNYFNQLGFVENRFFSPSRHMGIFFTWYDSFTGVPVCQQNISLEKASILFNIGALYTQIGTRCDRQTKTGLGNAIDAFQKATGVLNHLKETFTHTPSYDMSPAMLGVLVKLMLAQAQECVFERLSLSGICNEYFSLLKMAQEAAKVSEVYGLVHNAMNQPPVKENFPSSWSYMTQVKLEHYRSLADYFIATALIDHQLGPNDDEDKQEKSLSQLYDAMPEGLVPLTVLKAKEERIRLGKAHLRSAIKCHEEAKRICSLCRNLKKINILQEILSVAHKRSFDKYSEHEKEDDFMDFLEVPDIIAKTEQKLEMTAPHLSKVKVTDFFQRLGPISVFSAKQRWTVPRTVHFIPEDGDLGFTLKGGSPVQVTCLDPLCAAANAGMKEGDYIVSVEGKDCKWLGVVEVLKLFKGVNVKGIEVQVVSLQDHTSAMMNKSATYSGGLPKTYSMICLATGNENNGKSRKVTKKLSFLSWGSKNRQKSVSTISLPSAVAGSSESGEHLSVKFNHFNNESSLY
ncbi:rhophilin-2 isoform X1 [Latimeria chalumnae]|uniref:rhophilin-2 isoform X1 n=1 Tax=Latimeria chalumnae TaxID=7897 RepID=UPI0003C1758B|nr:PREDICTED: rhophilin-2 isoform X1 [Latimeria chalumnae]|eukprot:XP_006003681.1 PREDICTED: rhophilin-2 isoform X1 [Latimeria chalumnae]